MGILDFAFKKKNVKDIKKGSSLIEPKISIPEKDMEKMFDDAVNNVLKNRVEVLVKRDLVAMVHGRDAVDQTIAAKNDYRKHGYSYDTLKNKYPKAIMQKFTHVPLIELPEISVQEIVKKLSNDFVEEQGFEA